MAFWNGLQKKRGGSAMNMEVLCTAAHPPGASARIIAASNRNIGAPSDNRSIRDTQDPRLKARFDLQYTTEENYKRWGLADAMSADAEGNWMVRRILRMRSRYEYENNGYYKHIVNTQANYVIGTGPTLQLKTKNRAFNERFESEHAQWFRAIHGPRKYKMLRMARNFNGEAFGLKRTNPNVRNKVKLDLFEIEADQCSSPLFGMYPAQYPDQYFDGVVLTPWGDPEYYHILRQHPGAFGAFVILGYEFDRWPARSVIHDFKRQRPGQQRGIPEMLPALPILNEIRGYSKAVRDAAANAARNTSVLETLAPAVAAQIPPSEWPDGCGFAGDAINLQDNMLNQLPFGFTLKQIKAEQPTTVFDMFVETSLQEVSVTAEIPLMFCTLNPAKANMSASYVVGQPMVKAILVDRLDYNDYSDSLLEDYSREWFTLEGTADVEGAVQEVMANHLWRWPRVDQHADPAKMAQAMQTRIATGVSSFPIECGDLGYDSVEVMESQASALGFTLEEYQETLRESLFIKRGIVTPASVTPDTKEGAPVTPAGDTDEGGGE